MSDPKLDYIRLVMQSRQQVVSEELNRKINQFSNSDYTKWNPLSNDTDGKDLWAYYQSCLASTAIYQPILSAVSTLDFELLRDLIDGIEDIPVTTKYLADYDILYNSTYFDE